MELKTEIQSYLLQIFKYAETQMPSVIENYLGFHQGFQIALIVFLSLCLLFAVVFMPIYLKIKKEDFLDDNVVLGIATIFSAILGIIGLPIVVYYYWLLKTCPEMYLLEILFQ
jgi:hypothetical protein